MKSRASKRNQSDSLRQSSKVSEFVNGMGSFQTFAARATEVSTADKESFRCGCAKGCFRQANPNSAVIFSIDRQKL